MLQQVMQPAFYYATVTMAVALASSLLLIRINHTLSSRWKSALIVLPLAFSMVAVFLFLPTIVNVPPPDGGPSYNLLQGKDRLLPHGLAPLDPFLSQGPPIADRLLSVTGALVALGLALGAASLAFSLVLGDRLARKLLKVVDLMPEDYPDLWKDVGQLSSCLDVRMPRLALIEDLRPNAFTFGWGRGTTVVFSLGILQLLDREELMAVAAHELAHVKNKDVWFRTAARALAWTHFFNPASHLSFRAAQREREKLADETARSVIEEKDTLLRAIEKVTSFLDNDGRKTSLATRLGLCFALSFSDKTSLMDDHPSFAERARSFRDGMTGRRFSPHTCTALSVAVLLVAAVVLMGLGEVREEILHVGVEENMPAMPMFEHHISFHPREGISMRADVNATSPVLVHIPCVPFDLCNHSL